MVFITCFWDSLQKCFTEQQADEIDSDVRMSHPALVKQSIQNI